MQTFQMQSFGGIQVIPPTPTPVSAGYFLDLSVGYKDYDHLETVTYYPKLSENPTIYRTPQSVPKVYREPVFGDDEWALSLGLVIRDAQKFNFWTSQLNGITPKEGDKVLDSAGIYWILRGTEALDLDVNGIQRYKTMCVRSASTT